MYLDYYGLNIKPFQISTDHRFLWLGEKHKEALAVLQYGILDNKGFLLLTGDVGTGKTTLLNALLASLGDEFQIALISDPGLARMDFFKFVADAFNLDKHFKSKGDFLLNLRSHLLDLHGQNKKALLIIDECQHLNQKLLEEVRLLSNIEKYNTKLINIFFVGQSEFNEIILRPRNRAIRQRITINYNIKALTEAETAEYIRFRLNVAGAQKELFTARALKEVFRFSNGYPRLINIICDHALLTGFVREKSNVGPRVVAECAEELKIPYDATANGSVATPEAADIRLNHGTVPASSGPPDRRASMPLVLALIVVVLIWIGLLATFFLDRQEIAIGGRTDQGAGDTPAVVSEETVRSTPEALPAGEPIVPPTSGDQVDAVLPAAGPSPTAGEEQGVPLRVPTPAASVTIGADPPKPVTAADAVAPPPDLRASDSSATASASMTVATAGNDVPPRTLSLDDIHTAFGAYPEVWFAFDSNALAAEAYDMLGLIARYCQQHPRSTIVLWGYTDRSGELAYNMKLAENRTDIVKTFLIGRGVRADAIQAVPVGPDTYGPDGMDVPQDRPRRKVLIEIRESND